MQCRIYRGLWLAIIQPKRELALVTHHGGRVEPAVPAFAGPNDRPETAVGDPRERVPASLRSQISGQDGAPAFEAEMETKT
jgi:hypothetical protein